MYKHLKSSVLLLVFVLNFVVAQTHSFPEQFSDTQGDSDWFYLYGQLGDYQEMQWQEGTWYGDEEFLFLQAGILHPGEASDVMVAWLSRQAGVWQLTGEVKDANARCGDGVEVIIQKNTDILWASDIENGDRVGLTYDLFVTLAVGDALIYRVNKRESNACDSTSWNLKHILQ